MASFHDPLGLSYLYSIDRDSCWQDPDEASAVHSYTSTVQNTNTSNERFFPPFAFDTNLDPALLHRPCINVSEYIEAVDQDNTVSNDYQLALNEFANLSAVQNIDAISFTPSTPFTPPYDVWADWLETPATSLLGNTPPYSPIADSLTQSEESDFICYICQECFDRRCDLNKHINRVHNKRARCPYEGCTQAPFGFEADLQRHIAAKHSVERKAEIKCTAHGCEEKFSRKDNMLRHMRKQHPGKKPSH
ncbi:hypothetical protein G6011_11676 [Alternaria panax]|uniref:C2H2-type domain-containing protein n=1 Tax=Alternaria panax TaxID=48097 RepID=A0AAD4IDV2_9PLEO|nr:hypothetical protein G6011_11676 [Alternaria panax]